MNRKTNLEHFLGLGHKYFDVVVVRMSAYANFLCHSLIDELVINQIALLLPVRGRTELDKMITALS